MKLFLLQGHLLSQRKPIFNQNVLRQFSTTIKASNAQKENNLTFNKFQGGVFVLPHMQKRHKGGEDAAVLTDRVLAVADGVGGWAE